MTAAGGIVCTVELGWPAKELSPNSRAHFMAKARAAKKAKEEAYWAARIDLPNHFKHDGSPLSFKVTAYPPDRRDRDDDNVSTKEYRDGIALAMGINDKLFTRSFEWGEPVKDGKIIVEIAA